MTSYIVYEAGLPLIAGYNHSQEYLGQNLGLESWVQQAFAVFACCTLHFVRY